ncbi:MAG TPA: ATP-dependent DNA ligase [Terriglobales bacterium]|nr:ATP-dependent DNA ligase [Terriglobales bacterium]
MKAFAELCESIAATSRKNAKIDLVAAYFRVHSMEESATAAIFLSGKSFPASDEATLQVGGSILWRVLEEITHATPSAMKAAYRKHGDLGSAAFDLLESKKRTVTSGLSLHETEGVFHQLSRSKGQTARMAQIKDLFAKASAREVKYLVKIMTGDLRIGLRESLVEDAIANAFEREPAAVRRANMLLGDIGQALRLAAGDQLSSAKLRIFHPIAMMLASPAQHAEEAFGYFEDALVEDKYDGIRAQAHIGGEGEAVRIFSRTLDDITKSFPELADGLRQLRGPLILDGEIVAWAQPADGDALPLRALPFSDLQQRLGRKDPSKELMFRVPVAYVAFDVLAAGNDLTIDLPLNERKRLLSVFVAGITPVKRFIQEPAGETTQQQLFAVDVPPGEKVVSSCVLPSPVKTARTAAELDVYFAEAQARGNEGLMVKDVTSTYTPGRRGRSWLKIKRELATLDVVVTAVEYGHGRRAAVLSDYTFAIRDGDALLNVGKAYSGLTDAEIAELTPWFMEHTIENLGHLRVVEPKIVLEVAFNNMMQSERHESGFALRFPRILRIRTDKSPEEIDTIERVREVYASQKLPAAAKRA